jgi:hypothetical protein
MSPSIFSGNNSTGWGGGRRHNINEQGKIGSGRFAGSDERGDRNEDMPSYGGACRGNGRSEQGRAKKEDVKNSQSPGGDDRRKSHKPSPLHFQKLRRMLAADATDAVLDLLKHEEQLQHVLDDPHIKDDFIELLLEILAKVISAEIFQQVVN